MTIKRQSAIRGKQKRVIQKTKKRRTGTSRKSRLSDPEAETLFIIWQSNRPINNADIAEEHFKYFNPDVKKTEGTVRGIINRIKNTERHSRRKYILSSEERPHVYKIDTDGCVHSQGTAIMLLELKKGYLVWGNSLKEIRRKPFQAYLNEKYPASSGLFRGPRDIADRIKLAKAKEFAKFEKYGTIEAFTRLDFDLPYLLLIVEDYARDLKNRSRAQASGGAAELHAKVRDLVSLFGHPPTGGSHALIKEAGRP